MFVVFDWCMVWFVLVGHDRARSVTLTTRPVTRDESKNDRTTRFDSTYFNAIPTDTHTHYSNKYVRNMNKYAYLYDHPSISLCLNPCCRPFDLWSL